MYTITRRVLIALASALGCATANAHVLERLVITNQPSPIPGELIIDIRPVAWKASCLPIKYRMNSTLAEIRNPYNDETLPLATAVAGIRAAMKAWSEIPTSFAEMRLEGTVANPNPPGFDFVNEVSFIHPELEGGASAFTSLHEFPVDTTLTGGEDIDGDGDPDVSAAIQTCRDLDNDGDHEIPAGFYEAGTLFEADVVFTDDYQWLVSPREITDPTRDGSAILDLVGIAAHEFGHSIGLQHTMVTEIGGSDGTGSTVADGYFGGIGWQLGSRSLSEEDKAWASYRYPEGSARSGPAALQHGDVAFDHHYSIISGKLTSAWGNPLVGPSVFARNYEGEIVSSAIVGQVQWSYNPATGLSRILTAAFGGVIDGSYELPVPKGIYKVGVEGVDLAPYPFARTFAERGLLYVCGSMGWRVCSGMALGHQFFREEYWSGPLEGAAENHFGAAMPVAALSKTRKNIDFVIDPNVNVVYYTQIDRFLFTGAGTILAARLPRGAVLQFDQGQGVSVQAATFYVNHFEAAKVPIFDAAMITTGKVAADGTARIDLRRPLVREAPFVAQDEDDSPLYVHNAKLVGDFVRDHMPADEDLFLVLSIPKKTFQPPQWLLDYGWTFAPNTSALRVAVDVLEAGDPFASNAFVSHDGGRSFLPDPEIILDFELIVLPR